jgi:hypothetical protein
VERLKQFFRDRQETTMKKNETEAKRIVLEEIFNDIYSDRKRVYKINFFRGILFGAGSAIGGTIVLALIVWLLSLFVDAPLVGELFENAQQSIEQTTTDSPSD